MTATASHSTLTFTLSPAEMRSKRNLAPRAHFKLTE